MGGLSLPVGGFGGVRKGGFSDSAPGMGPASYQQAAFGPSYTAQAPTTGSIVSPNDGFGIALWLGVAAIVALVCVRQSLPGS